MNKPVTDENPRQLTSSTEPIERETKYNPIIHFTKFFFPLVLIILNSNKIYIFINYIFTYVICHIVEVFVA